MSRIGVFVCCAVRTSRARSMWSEWRKSRQAARRALRAYQQVQRVLTQPGDDPREDRVGQARRRGSGFLLAAHAHENLPQDGCLCGIEPLHV